MYRKIMGVAQHVLPEGADDLVAAQITRIQADGGTIVSEEWIRKAIWTLKNQGIYANCKFLGDANMGVKLDASGVSVQTLYDLSGNNNDATSGVTVNNQPVWTANVQGGRAGLVFDGTDDVLTAAIGTLSQPNTIITAIKNTRTVFTVTNVFIDTTNAVNRLSMYAQQTSGVLGASAGTDGLSATAIGTTAQILTGLFNGASSVLYKNGASILAADFGAADMTGLSIGDYSAGGYPYEGSFFPVIVINAALTTAQRTALETFVNAYYSIY